MKRTLILGATSDIAIPISHELLKKKVPLILASRNESENIKLVSDLKIRYSTDILIEKFDANDLESHQSFFERTKDKIDTVICLVGYMGKSQECDESYKEIQNIVYSNYLGLMCILNLFAHSFAKEKKGKIVGVSSVAGDRGRGSNFLYGSAKAGFTAYLSGLRNKMYPHNVQVITVKPGFIFTKMTKDIKLPKLLTAQPETVSKQILLALENNKDVLYTKSIWFLIMLIIKSIPERIFKKLNL